MILCDSHGHLQMLPPGDLPDVLSRARDAGVGHILVPGTTVEDSCRAVELAEIYANVVAAVGIHPHEARDFEPTRDLARFEELCRSPKVVAVGEIGLDFHYDYSPRESQISCFQAQLAFARAQDLPVLLHNRESGAPMLEILKKVGFRLRAGVFHSFTENAEFGREAIALGFKISFSGMLTFKSADNIREAAAALPLSELLVETDAPYLAPAPFRGKPCEPAHVAVTAAKLAEIKHVSAAEAAAATTANFEALFLSARENR